MPGVIENIIFVLVGIFITKLYSFLSRIIKSHISGRNKIKHQIEITINREFKINLKEGCGIEILRKGLVIEWNENVQKESYLNNDGDVVIKLSYENDKNLSRSFVKTLMLYLEEAFIPEAKPFIGIDLHDGCKFTLAKELTFRKDAETYRHFLSDYLSPMVQNDHKFEIMINNLDLMSRRGSFRSVFLRELYLLCEKGFLPNADMRKEAKEFLEFVWNIANKKEYFQERGEEPPLSFIKKYIKISIILVKKKTTQEIDRHICAVEHAFENGAKSVYVTGWGNENIKNTKRIAETLESRGHHRLCEISYNAELEDSILPALCIVFSQTQQKKTN